MELLIKLPWNTYTYQETYLQRQIKSPKSSNCRKQLDTDKLKMKVGFNLK